MVESNEKKPEETTKAAVPAAPPRFMKYYDATYQRAYYFDTETQESIWVLPEGTNEDTDVLDCIEKED